MRQLPLYLAILLIPAPAFAQAAKPPAPAQGSSAAAAAPEAPAAERHNVVATVVSVDVEKSTITFKDAQGQSQTWKVEGKAAARLKGLKAGNKVKIAYSIDEKGAPKAATSIRFVKGKSPEAL